MTFVMNNWDIFSSYSIYLGIDVIELKERSKIFKFLHE